jgi:hypothetical protein
MLIHPNCSPNYRKWAYCSAKILASFKELELYSSGKVTNYPEYYKIKRIGREAYNEYCLKKCHTISRKINRYIKLRDQMALDIDAPEKHLLQKEDMLNMVGNVIEITTRHAKEKSYCLLNECSSDGSKINNFDAYDMLALGYGK